VLLIGALHEPQHVLRDIELTGGDAGKVLKVDDIPFRSAKQVADVIVGRAGLR
jgi:hypothetical protein